MPDRMNCAGCGRVLAAANAHHDSSGRVLCRGCLSASQGQRLEPFSVRPQCRAPEALHTATSILGRGLGFLAACALIGGVFLPFAEVRELGSISLMDVSEVEGILTLICGAVALALVFTPHWKWLPVIGLVAVCIVTASIVHFAIQKERLARLFSEIFAESPLEGLGKKVEQSIQLTWGICVLITAAVGLLLAGWLSYQKRSARS